MDLDYSRIVIPESFPDGNSKSICHSLAGSIHPGYSVTDEVNGDDLLIIGGAGGRLTGWINFAKQNNINFLCVEKGYLNWKKPVRYRITPNNNQTTLIKKGLDDSRFREFSRKIKSWNTGEHILIVCPSEKIINEFFDNLTLDEWIKNTIIEIKKYSSKNIIVRKKPSKKERNILPFTTSLTNCHCVVTFHSMAAAEALCEGIPVFNLSNGAFNDYTLADLSLIETPLYPNDRQDLFNCLAYLQFTQAEIADGMAWSVVKNYFS